MGTPKVFQARLHWTLPVLVMVGTGFRPQVWSAVAVVALLAVNAAGQQVVAWLRNVRIVALDLHGVGALAHSAQALPCRTRSAITCGGWAAQAVVLVAAWAMPDVPTDSAVRAVVVMVNGSLLLVNLLPFAPFAGVHIWPVAFPGMAPPPRRLSEMQRDYLTRGTVNQLRAMDRAVAQSPHSAAAELLAAQAIAAATNAVRTKQDRGVPRSSGPRPPTGPDADE
ncbi:MAG: hypothetical protein HY904_08700 [Deltaproteobacteria bacterium]|nr:hypothetical protein [Deltaproteobacteria bacterium]